MLNSEFNLYNREWLSLVFNNRNQNYGAYELRRSYSGVLTRAMGITFFTVAALCVTETVISRNRPVKKDGPIIIEVPIPPKDPVIDATKAKVEPPKQTPKTEQPKDAAPSSAPQISTTEYREMKAVPDVLAEDVKAPDPNLAVGSETKIVENSPALQNAAPGDEKGKGDGAPAVDNNTYVAAEGGLQAMPEPIGGDKAWAKFLQKNLRFPLQAQDAGVSGKVFLSFIIEKDGHLSNINVERKAGFGFDEEASRVLKLAPAWKPGMQNGQPVRVRYMIPINFQLTEQ